MAVYESELYPFSIQYPADWTEDPTEPGSFQARSDELFFTLNGDLIADGLGTMSVEELADFFLSIFGAAFDDFVVESREQVVIADGLTAEVVHASALAGVLAQSYIFYVHEGRIAFVAGYLGLKGRMDELEGMIDYSFSTFQVHTEESFLLKWGERGTGDSQFKSPAAIAVDASGNV